MGKTLALSTLLFVHIFGDGNTPAWKARALEGTVSQYLTRFEKLQLAEDLQVSDFNCEEQDATCLIEILPKPRVIFLMKQGLRSQ